MTAKILIVDDEKTARMSLADILRMEGYNVSTAENGVEAVKLFSETAFDLMLLDIKMPGMDGVEVMQKAVEVSPDTLIILLTAHGSMESAVAAPIVDPLDHNGRGTKSTRGRSQKRAGACRR